jgi:sarcosine oxidase delta subunit
MHELECPRCGRRPLDEFTFGGERRPTVDWLTDPDDRDFDDVWVLERWLTVRRDTSVDRVVDVR